ncbi:MAG: pilus assembly protein [Alphaproteobacteria bacterium]|nr:pilus assembly protein [Alphaproteobacteria bacterium]
MSRFTKMIFNGGKKIKETSCRGSVFVEFAVWMPLLIILLFYICDLVKIKRYYSQTEFIGQQIVNIIQNISGGASVTKNNLKYALCLANLSMLPGMTMYTQDANYHGYTTLVQIYRVVGAGSGKAKCTSRIELSAWNGQQSPEKIWYACTSEDYAGSKVRYSSTAVAPSQIYSTLEMGAGSNTTEEKIVVDICLLTDSTIRPSGKSAERQILGLYQAMPPFLTNSDDRFRFYFHSVVIFTPKKGLFSNSCPSEPKT